MMTAIRDRMRRRDGLSAPDDEPLVDGRPQDAQPLGSRRIWKATAISATSAAEYGPWSLATPSRGSQDWERRAPWNRFPRWMPAAMRMEMDR